MFCRKCGKQLDDGFKVCPYCGEADVSDGASDSNENIGGWKALGFFLGFFGPALWFLPLVSLVLYFIWKGDKPKVAKGMGQFTLIGLAVGAGLALIIVIIIGVLFAITASMTVFEMIRSFFNGSLNGINDLINNIPFIG